ncbi:MAG: response regulator transcription factor [Lachnospiraceae bacterium]|nr:response regulator transcription factor [Lachnospiraceae bacterium]
MVFKVAVCDDDQRFTSSFIRFIQNTAAGRTLDLEFSEYYSGESILDSIGYGMKFDLIFLDMELKGLNGIETAERLRERDTNVLLVFCTGKVSPSPESFKASPYRYLLKTFSNEQLELEINSILKKLVNNNQRMFLPGKNKDEIIRVYVQNVLYLENSRRGSTAYILEPTLAEERSIPISSKLDNIEKEYPDFVRIHRSYLVNINHVDRVDIDKVVLDNNTELSVSRPYRKELRLFCAKHLLA